MAKWKSAADIARIKRVKANLERKRTLPLPEPPPQPVITCIFPDAKSNVKRDALDTESYEEKPKRTAKKKKKKNDRD